MYKKLFPKVRPRRLRQNNTIRNLVSDTTISRSKLIQPLFVSDTIHSKQEISSMPGQYLYSSEDIFNEIESLKNCGINTVALFPNINTEVKDPLSKEALNENNFMCQLVHRIKKEFPDIMLVLDVALDPYNSNGHDGIVIDGKVDNDVTLDALKKCQ